MLVRVILFLRDGHLVDRVRAAIRDADVMVLDEPHSAESWNTLASRGADIVIVETTAVPAPLKSSLRALAQLPESPAIVLLDDSPNPEERARRVAAGATLVLSPGLPPDILRAALRRVIHNRRELASARLRTEDMDALVPRLADFVSASPAMHAFMEVVHRVVDTDTTVLLLGETGVGKERLARAIHAESRRASSPFVAVNCAAIPESLIESELFGHAEGAFTGATRARRGWFELAHGGTLFLDEVGELPLHLQAKLLRAIQERSVQPVGAEHLVPVDVRFMAASNRDLETDAEDGSFRRDLFYRLSVVTLRLPSLRDRRGDIPSLVRSYLEHFGSSLNRPGVTISSGAMEALESHDWPGNVRELMNVMERAVLLCDGNRVTEADLPADQSPSSAVDSEGAGPPPPGEDEAWWNRPWSEVREDTLAAVERRYLSHVLTEAHGRIGDAAHLAGISSRALYGKMRRLGLRKEDFRLADR